jgi:hypothetical protein
MQPTIAVVLLWVVVAATVVGILGWSTRRDAGFIAICSFIYSAGNMLEHDSLGVRDWPWPYWLPVTIGLVALCKYLYLRLRKGAVA